MKAQTRTTRSARTRIAAQGVVALLTVGGLLTAGASSAQAATSVGLGTADSFAVLAGSGISNTGTTTISGDVGLSPAPATAFTGSAIVMTSGVQHLTDGVAAQAQLDLTTAYNAAKGQPAGGSIFAITNATTLLPGVYTSGSSISLDGNLILDAAGDPNAVFVFQALTETLVTASGSSVSLINGAQACNVFWQVGSSATLGTGSTFRGTILALASITLTTGATVDGRVLASNGAVTLDGNTITRSTCSTPSTGDTSGSTTSAYAANVGPNAQGLVCPWGGVYNGGGLCVGTGANSLMNPSPTSTTPTTTSTTPTTTSTTPAPTSTTPTTTSTTPAPTSTTPTIAHTPTSPASGPGSTPSQQVPTKPSGGVGTGDNTTG
jgi:cell division septation protein DedD